MNKIRKTAVMASLLTAIGFGLTGCEWGTPGDGEYWSDSYNWINFSGVYKNPNGGSVVTDYTSAATTNTTGSTVVPISSINIQEGNGGNSYSGSLPGAPVVPGSVKITAGGVVFSDDAAGNLTPSPNLATMGGSISYSDGGWAIDLGGIVVPNGTWITASYSVYQSTGGGTIGGAGTDGKNHGTTGTTILSFTAIQEGNLITLIDSDGMSYAGKMGSVRSVSGDMGTSPRKGDVVIAQYTVKGTSRVGMTVEIVGVFQGSISVSGGASTFVMSARSLQGQWVEKGGKVGDVIGASKDAAINWVNTGTVSL